MSAPTRPVCRPTAEPTLSRFRPDQPREGERIEPPRPLPPLRRARKRSFTWTILRLAVILSVWLTLVAGAVLIWLSRDLPRPETALDASRRPGLTLQDRSGRTFATFGDIVGEPLRLANMPKTLPAAAVSVEDRRFWSHPGIDVVGIGRAIWVNLRSGRLVQGGSTITQQVAKTLFLTNARTARRKVQELLLTLWLEQTFTKKEILEIWLNRVYLGAGAWGVDAAARIYFGISARNLNLWQSAVLAGLPRAPSRFNPRVDPSAAATRGREVLTAMAETGAITQAEAEAAGRQIAFPPRPAAAGWFADWIADASQAVIPPNADAVLQTTLDARLQGIAETRLAAMLDGPGAAADAGQGAVIVLDSTTGAVRAMVGGHDYRTSPYNRAVAARRQPGSAFKPIVWLTALEQGAHPDDTILDAPLRIGNWSPQNFDKMFHGEVTLETALAQSLNTAAVRLAQQSGGPRDIAAVAREVGIASPLPADLSVALGTGEVGLLELSAAYATIFNGGRLVTPMGLESARADRRPIPIPRPPMRRVIDLGVSAEMVRMLTAVVLRGSGRAAAIAGRFVAGKTGTTQDFRDAWFIGAVGTTVIGVWLGNDDAQPMRGITGSSLPAQLFRQIAAEIR